MQAKNEMEAIKALNEKVAGIVESGSNENGSWVKFADGTMICYGRKTILNVEFIQTGGIYYSERQDFTYPQTFKENPTTTVSGRTSNMCWIGNPVSYTNNFTFNILHSVKEIRSVVIEWQAIGRWK